MNSDIPIAPNAPKLQTAAYEFTKRKRWMDTLFSETSEAIFLIVSPSFKVLCCSSAVVEILGWKEDQLVDRDLGSFVEEEDLQNLLWAFTETLRSGHSLFTYTRFKYEHPPSMTSVPSLLFEVKGRVHCFSGQPHSRCVFLSAMPYPSRDIALLNSFLELRIENERLSRRIREVKHFMDSPVSSQEGASTLNAQSPVNRYAQGNSSGVLLKNSSSLFMTDTDASQHASSMCSEPANSDISNYTSDSLASTNSLDELSFNPDPEYDEMQRKKKKTIIGEDQRVCMTCGRTDSPEWRKGPHGPKTLCNACGLRWAKRARKEEPEIVTILKSSSVLSSEDHSAAGLVSHQHMGF